MRVRIVCELELVVQRITGIHHRRGDVCTEAVRIRGKHAGQLFPVGGPVELDSRADLAAEAVRVRREGVRKL